jgi:4-hydroxy-tetrahydrodipicolinate synthase
MEVLEFVMKKNNGSKPVIFGLGGNNTRAIVNKLTELNNYPIEAILSVSPYYNKPSQQGIQTHYQTIADQSQIPIILYNVPGRTASNISLYTSLLLAEHPMIIGIKEASGRLTQVSEIIAQRPADFMVWSGDDPNTFEIMKMGAEGTISVIGNLLPEETHKLISYLQKKDIHQARILNNHLVEMYDLLVKEGNPTSVKTGLSLLGIIQNHMRLPLVPGSEQLKVSMEHTLKKIKKAIR